MHEVLEGTPYQALRLIGRGGMGEVYLARGRAQGTELVVKVLRPELGGSPRLVKRLRREARSLQALDHPNIVKVFGSGETADGLPFLAMERLNGSTLAEELRADRHPVLGRVLADMLQVLSGLGAAHSLGLVHRDIKASNLFAHRDPDHGRVMKLLDFGVVKVLGDEGYEPALTTAGFAIGTPRFMSPEQARAGRVDGRSDLYSLGLLLYGLVCNRGPFDDCRREVDIIGAHLRRQPEAPSVYARDPIPSELDRAILKALEKNPNDRFQSAAEFADALREVAEGLKTAVGWLETTVFSTASLAPLSARPTEGTLPTEKDPAARSTGASAPVSSGTLPGPGTSASVSDGPGSVASGPDPAQPATNPKLSPHNCASDETRIQFPAAGAAPPPDPDPNPSPGPSSSPAPSPSPDPNPSPPGSSGPNPSPGPLPAVRTSHAIWSTISPQSLILLFLLVATVGAWLVSTTID